MSENEPLFQPFEQRPAQCSAVYVSYDNIDRIARYYASDGYDATVVREKGHPDRLIIARSDRDESGVVVTTEQVLVYGHPPSVMEPDDFRRDWRTAREQQ